MRATFGFLCLAVFCLVAGAAWAGEARHGLSLFGDLKYGPDFTHFDYVNPEAPKGGAISFAAEGTYNSLNPFILRGDPVQGLESFVFETLLERALDEPDAAYGLIAASVEVSPDRSWEIFNLRPEARWHDGTPITAEDVVFSVETLKAHGHPYYRVILAEVASAEMLDPRRVRITFSNTENRKLPLIVGTQLPILSKAHYEDREFDRVTLEPPLGSGPYRVARVNEGRSIVYERVPDYWGRGLPVRVGRHNFDEIRIEYFRDRTIMVEALKAREYEFHEEFTSKTWMTAYDIPEIADGRMIREVLADNTPSGVQAFFINTRREKFRDPRVRQALALAFDFEWTNANLFYSLYDRMGSYFENSNLAAEGLPGPDELAILEAYRGRVPDEVFNELYEPPRADGDDGIRKNLQAARSLFEEAGWVIDEGRLVSAETGEQFTIEFLYFLRTFERVIAPYAVNLRRLGIEASLRLVDASQYQRRLEEFDFDLTTSRYVQDLSPSIELRNYFAGDAADTMGSDNIAGIRDPVVDELIEEVLSAPDRASLIAACHALDRVLLWGHYMVPQWYKGEHHLVYWNKFGRPEVKPLYDRGVLDIWWIDAEREAALNALDKGLD
ncbi:MAG: extracellular solute-binding protein [Alphaproteobacteria bacterium]